MNCYHYFRLVHRTLRLRRYFNFLISFPYAEEYILSSCIIESLKYFTVSLITRSSSLAHVNAMLREQLDQATAANQSLTADIHKLTADWQRAREDLEIKENEWREEEQVHLETSKKIIMAGFSVCRSHVRACGLG